MKGILIDFSIQTNGGLISGDDGNRYTFIGAEWRENVVPIRGMRVDFDTNANNIATAIYQEVIARPKRNTENPFQSIKTNAPNAKIILKNQQDDYDNYYEDESDYTMLDWYKKVIINYVNFEGRARRKEYWYFTLVNILVGFALGLTAPILDELSVLLYWLYMLAVFLPSLGVTVRRLHDTNRSGWWLLVSFIPLLGALLLLIWVISDSDYDENEYGLPPK